MVGKGVLICCMTSLRKWSSQHWSDLTGQKSQIVGSFALTNSNSILVQWNWFCEVTYCSCSRCVHPVMSENQFLCTRLNYVEENRLYDINWAPYAFVFLAEASWTTSSKLCRSTPLFFRTLRFMSCKCTNSLRIHVHAKSSQNHH